MVRCPILQGALTKCVHGAADIPRATRTNNICLRRAAVCSINTYGAQSPSLIKGRKVAWRMKKSRFFVLRHST